MTDRLSMSEYKRLTAQMSVSATGRVVPVSKPVDTGTTLSLPYPISANRYWRHARGMTFVSAEGKEFIKQVAVCAARANLRRLQGDVRVTYWLHPRQNKDGSASKSRIDLGNCEKVCSDALNGLAWDDDKQIVDLHLILGEPKPSGGLTVEISECGS